MSAAAVMGPTEAFLGSTARPIYDYALKVERMCKAIRKEGELKFGAGLEAWIAASFASLGGDLPLLPPQPFYLEPGRDEIVEARLDELHRGPLQLLQETILEYSLKSAKSAASKSLQRPATSCQPTHLLSAGSPISASPTKSSALGKVPKSVDEVEAKTTMTPTPCRSARAVPQHPIVEPQKLENHGGMYENVKQEVPILAGKSSDKKESDALPPQEPLGTQTLRTELAEESVPTVRCLREVLEQPRDEFSNANKIADALVAPPEAVDLNSSLTFGMPSHAFEIEQGEVPMVPVKSLPLSNWQSCSWQSCSLFAPKSLSAAPSVSKANEVRPSDSSIRNGIPPSSPCPSEPHTPKGGEVDPQKLEMMKRIEAGDGSPVSVLERKRLFEGKGSTPMSAPSLAMARLSATSSVPVPGKACVSSGTVAQLGVSLSKSSSGPSIPSSIPSINASSMFTPMEKCNGAGVRKELFRSQASGPSIQGSSSTPCIVANAQVKNSAPTSSSACRVLGAKSTQPAPSINPPVQLSKSCSNASLQSAPSGPPTARGIHIEIDANCDRLAAGIRRDVEKPRSLIAAEAAKEQAKVHEEKKMREKQEREQERERKAAQVAQMASSAMAASSLSSGVAEGVCIASKKKALRRSATMEALTEDCAVLTEQGCTGLQMPPATPVDSFKGVQGEIQAYVSSPSELDKWKLLRDIKLASPRAEDNYEISEAGADSEAEDQRDRSDKHVPAWCANYLEELQNQRKWDPDTIFGRVPACNLEDVFTDAIYAGAGKDRPRRRRGSSGDWRKDKLTKQEIKIYKDKMGQKKAWDEPAK